MTNREFLTNVIAIENAPEDVKEKATALLAKLDATNEARKNKPSKKDEENAPLMDKIYDEILGTEAVIAATVAETMGVSVQKANGLLRKLVAEQRAEVTDVKVPGKGTVKGYTKIALD